MLGRSLHTVSVQVALNIIVGDNYIIRMDGLVVNTVQFRFPSSSPRPSWPEIASFLKQLDVDLAKLETAYKTSQDRSLFVKFTSPEAMKEALEKNTEPRRFVYASGTSVEVRMAIAGRNACYVRIFDLPPELSDECLALALGDYGKVEWITREKFPANLGLDHLYTGVRGVYMDVEKDIPPSIVVGNRKGQVFYDGLKDVCFLCRGVGHRKKSCPQRQVRNKPEGRNVPQSTSYAAIVSGQGAVPEEQQPTELVEDVIEVLDEDVLDSPGETESEEQWQTVACSSRAEQEKEIRRKEAIEELTEVAKAFGEAITRQNASQRRAQFASAGSGSKEHSRPKKLCARRSNY